MHRKIAVHYFFLNYSSDGAPTGQLSAQAPQEMQVSGSIL